MRAPSRIGGKYKSQYEREPAMRKFDEEAGPVVVGGWRHQCRCGSTGGRLYRRRYWCDICGTERTPFNPLMKP